MDGLRRLNLQQLRKIFVLLNLQHLLATLYTGGHYYAKN